MNKVRTIPAVLAGLVGTAVMTVWMYVAPLLGLPKMNAPRWLGLLFVRGTAAPIVGWLLHLLTGSIFSLSFAWLWTKIGKPNWRWGLVFGAGGGFVAILSWLGILAAHPVVDRKMTAPLATNLFVGHLIFGLASVVPYRVLAEQERTAEW
jgi:hypothetical protein